MNKILFHNTLTSSSVDSYPAHWRRGQSIYRYPGHEGREGRSTVLLRDTKGTDWVNGEKAVLLLFKSIKLSDEEKKGLPALLSLSSFLFC